MTFAPEFFGGKRRRPSKTAAATFQCNPHCSPPSWGSCSPTLAPSNDDRTSIILRGKRSCQSPGICCGRSPTSRQRPQQLDNVTPLALLMGNLQNLQILQNLRNLQNHEVFFRFFSSFFLPRNFLSAAMRSQSSSWQDRRRLEEERLGSKNKHQFDLTKLVLQN